MPTLTLGISPCPNDVFVFSGLLLNTIDTGGLDFDVNFQDVENLNHLAQSGGLDVVKISYANYIHCRQAYDLLSSGGALGRGVGPLLLTNAEGGRRKEEKNNASSSSFILPPSSFDFAREVLVPGEYTTANFLLDFYLNHFTLNHDADPDGSTPLQKRFLPFDTLYEELCRTPGTQGVVIHEKRFTYARDGLTLVQDLGEHWEQQTGYVIPLGAICVRRSLGLTAPLDALIQRSLAWAYANYADAFAICRQYAQDLSEGVIESHIKLYVNQYTEALGAEGKAAVTYFLNKQKHS